MSAESSIKGLLTALGEDVTREGLLETPSRAASAFEFWTSGYGKDPKEILKAFEDGKEDYDEMVIVKGIDVYSMCEHHLAPFFGKAYIAYIPSDKIVGLSKLTRVTDMFARRFQVQERLTQQIAGAINEVLSPVGVGVVIKCRHMCMESRGVQQPGTETVTSCLLGSFKEQAVRTEFFGLI